MTYKRTLLVVFGSPHKNGITASMLKAFESGLPPETSVIHYDCFSEMPSPCIDCRLCAEQPRCAFEDLDGYDTALRTADAIVFASPVYNSSFPAPVKALIDRSQRYWNARFVRKESFSGSSVSRPVVLLSCSGSNAHGSRSWQPHMPGLEEILTPMLTLINAHLKSCVHYTGGDFGPPTEAVFKAAQEAAEKLFQEV